MPIINYTTNPFGKDQSKDVQRMNGRTYVIALLLFIGHTVSAHIQKAYT